MSRSDNGRQGLEDQKDSSGSSSGGNSKGNGSVRKHLENPSTGDSPLDVYIESLINRAAVKQASQRCKPLKLGHRSVQATDQRINRGDGRVQARSLVRPEPSFTFGNGPWPGCLGNLRSPAPLCCHPGPRSDRAADGNDPDLPVSRRQQGQTPVSPPGVPSRSEGRSGGDNGGSVGPSAGEIPEANRLTSRFPRPTTGCLSGGDGGKPWLTFFSL